MNRVVSKQEWLEARKAHLKKEKELTRLSDELAAERRALPWTKVEKNYQFQTPNGIKTLSELFGQRSQLMIQHFMLGPGWDAGCPGCSFMADHVDGARLHFEHNDLSYVAVSRAPLAEIEAYQKRMGWTFPWFSACGDDFNIDYGVYFTDEQVATGKVTYNYAEIDQMGNELHGLSVFLKSESGDIFHTYSTYARGADIVMGAYRFLDMTPKGRNEKSTMEWIKRHDEYGVTSESGECCH